VTQYEASGGRHSQREHDARFLYQHASADAQVHLELLRHSIAPRRSVDNLLDGRERVRRMRHRRHDVSQSLRWWGNDDSKVVEAISLWLLGRFFTLSPANLELVSPFFCLFTTALSSLLHFSPPQEQDTMDDDWGELYVL
jgi:hypothetical protein